jgi:2-oxoglutarate ferredoxin oxidoreductase subunit alpha
MNRRPVSDLTMMVAGQGGDGSLTLTKHLAGLFGMRGFHLYQSRNVASRIKGGHAAAHMRASIESRGCLGDTIDLLVAFDDEAIEHGAGLLSDRAFVIHDDSDGPAAMELLPGGVTVLEVPFGRLAVRDLRRDLFKNSLALGVATRVVGFSDQSSEMALRRSLGNLTDALVDANVKALQRGFEYADERGLAEGEGPWDLASAEPVDRLLVTGNEATAFGFLAAGGRFYAGYPITPATEILEWLERRLPEFGGVVVQAEDELAAINMVIGAALTGTRAMTATSGPGISLMQEGISHMGAAEVGAVVVDSQRSGPSTGMPTKPEQSDIGMLVYGGNGDFPRIVLAPADPGDAFVLSAFASDLAERFQGPVIIALDQMTSQDSRTVDQFEFEKVQIDHGKTLGESELATIGEYRRYLITHDGVSPVAHPGTFGGQNLTTGNEHDEWGKVSTEPSNRRRMIDKRAQKMETVRSELPKGKRFGNSGSEVGLLGFGMETGVMHEAAERLELAGRPVSGMSIRTLWPILDDTMEFIESCSRVYVVEHNATAQLAKLLLASGAAAGRIRSVIAYDGIPFGPTALVERIVEWEEANA